jgi:hypothetical protein
LQVLVLQQVCLPVAWEAEEAAAATVEAVVVVARRTSLWYSEVLGSYIMVALETRRAEATVFLSDTAHM